MKLAMLFQKTDLPDAIENLIEEFTIHTLFRKFLAPRFLAAYGQQRARFCGQWHPRIPFHTRDRYIWSAFHIGTQDDRHRFGDPMDIQIAKPLEGRMVLIVYRNRHGNITKMDPKRVVHAAQDRMRVDGSHNGTGEFNVYYQGVQSIELFVDVARAAAI